MGLGWVVGCAKSPFFFLLYPCPDLNPGFSIRVAAFWSFCVGIGGKVGNPMPFCRQNAILFSVSSSIIYPQLFPLYILRRSLVDLFFLTSYPHCHHVATWSRWLWFCKLMNLSCLRRFFSWYFFFSVKLRVSWSVLLKDVWCLSFLFCYNNFGRSSRLA